MSKPATFTPAQQRALDLLIGEWAVLGYLRLSAVHASTLKALIGHGFLDPETHTLTRAGLHALSYWGDEIDAMWPAIERAQRAAGEVAAIRAQLRAATERERVAERAAAHAREQARAAVKAKREARHV